VVNSEGGNGVIGIDPSTLEEKINHSMSFTITNLQLGEDEFFLLCYPYYIYHYRISVYLIVFVYNVSIIYYLYLDRL